MLVTFPISSNFLKHLLTSKLFSNYLVFLYLPFFFLCLSLNLSDTPFFSGFWYLLASQVFTYNPKKSVDFQLVIRFSEGVIAMKCPFWSFKDVLNITLVLHYRQHQICPSMSIYVFNFVLLMKLQWTIWCHQLTLIDQVDVWNYWCTNLMTLIS